MLEKEKGKRKIYNELRLIIVPKCKYPNYSKKGTRLKILKKFLHFLCQMFGSKVRVDMMHNDRSKITRSMNNNTNTMH